MTLYDIGDSVRVSVTFTDRDGVTTDPSVIVLALKNPKGTKTSYTYGSSGIVRTGTGAYYYDVTANLPGTWRYGWTGTGALVVVEDDRFEVQRRVVTE